jgi:hypothetical protein
MPKQPAPQHPGELPQPEPPGPDLPPIKEPSEEPDLDPIKPVQEPMHDPVQRPERGHGVDLTTAVEIELLRAAEGLRFDAFALGRGTPSQRPRACCHPAADCLLHSGAVFDGVNW